MAMPLLPKEYLPSCRLLSAHYVQVLLCCAMVNLLLPIDLLPYADCFSGHCVQVLLCRAMVKQPPLLILDEPTHGLQGDMRRRLLAMLSGLADDPDHSIVYVSHHSDEVDALGFENVLQL